MVGDHAVGNKVFRPLFVRMPHLLLDLLHDRCEEVGLVAIVFSLDEHGKALQAHACIHPVRGQRASRSVRGQVELHENQIPDFQESAVRVVVEVVQELRAVQGSARGREVVVDL